MLKYFFIPFFLSVFGTPVVYAESVPRGFSVSPMFQELSLNANDREKDFLITLTNATDQTTSFSLSVLDFGGLDESGGVAFLGGEKDLEKKYSLAPWMKPEKEQVTLAPNESMDVRVIIENSASLSPGGHYGAITFKTNEDISQATAGNKIAVERLFSVLVFVKKIGGERYDLSLKGQENDGNSVLLPKTVRARFLNGGNVHIVPRGTITLTDPLGRVVSKGIINEESGILLPETFRVYPVQMQGLALSFFPGYYMIDIAYRYDGRDDFSVYSEQFAFLPGIAIIGVSLFLMGATGWYAWRRRKNTGEPLASQADIL